MADIEELTSRVCELIGVAVFCFATIMKVPQIMTIVKSGNTKGININSLMMEFWCFTIMLAYPMAKGYAFSSYMEFVTMTIQDAILVIMVLSDRAKLNVFTSAILALYISVIFGMALNWLPPWVLYIMSTSVTPISVSSKLLQLYSILKSKHAGAVSSLSWGLGACTSVARIFTGFVQSGDMFLVLLSTQAFFLNGAVCLSAWWYRPKAKTV